MNRLLPGLSGLCLGAAALAAVAAILGRWAINAEAWGAHDPGLALFLAFASSFALLGATWAAPVLVLAGALARRVDRRSGWRLLAAGILCAVPLAVYSWLD